MYYGCFLYGHRRWSTAEKQDFRKCVRETIFVQKAALFIWKIIHTVRPREFYFVQ